MQAERRASKGMTGRMIQKLSSMINVTKCGGKQTDEMMDRNAEDRCLSPLSDMKRADSPAMDYGSPDQGEGYDGMNDQRKLNKRGKNPMEKRKSTPAINLDGGDSKMKIGPRSSSQPVLVAFLPQYVNKLKAQPFSLKEKMTRWCKKSPYALIKKHLPPEDFYIEFPNEPYEDRMNDEFGRGLERLARDAEDEANGVSTKPRVEIVLERYPAGRHGLTCSFDAAPNNGDRFLSVYGTSGGNPSKSSRRSEPAGSSRHSLDVSNSRMNNRPSMEGGKPMSPVPAPRRQSQPVLRVPTDTSLLPMGPPGRQGSQDVLDLSDVRHRPSMDVCMSTAVQGRMSMEPMGLLADMPEVEAM